MVRSRLAGLVQGIVLAATALIGSAQADFRGVMESSALRAKLGQKNLVILDIRSGDTKELGAKLFASGHIPGAVHADYAFASWRLPREKTSVYLPEPAQFEALAGELGVSNDSDIVVVHDGNDATSFGSAARVYWTFKAMGHASIAILDGGYRGWTLAASNPVEVGAGQAAPSIYEAKPVPGLRASLDEVLAAQKSNITLIDSRPESYFTGLEKHKAVPAFGHISGAVSIPHSKAIGTDFKLKDKATLAKEFASVSSGPAISYCNTGHWAATDWFVLSEVLGKADVKLYDGSMLDYASEKRGPISNPRGVSGS